MSSKRKHQRGSVRTANSEFVGVLIPVGLLALLDQAVARTDSDRSKYLRRALREKLEAVNAR